MIYKTRFNAFWKKEVMLSHPYNIQLIFIDWKLIHRASEMPTTVGLMDLIEGPH